MPKVLIVENQEGLQRLLTEYLSDEGFESLLAAGAVEACEVAQQKQPDLILMDLHMPEKDGLWATRQLRSMPETRMIPVIALTADVDEEMRKKALAVGCNDFEPKPIDFPRLVAKMHSLLHGATPNEP